MQWDRALALLAGGDFARGFAAYDVRFDLEDPSMGFDRKLRAVRSVPLPLWQGEDPAGRTLYVYAEQGQGDTLQFARFLPLVARRGARIMFECPAELMRIFANFPGMAELRQEGSPLPQADFHLPMMSLPHRLGITLANLPAQVPYVAAPTTGPVLARPSGTRAAAGIVWAGRPQHTNDHNRSLTLEELLPLAELSGLTLYSLQKGPRADDIARIGARGLIHDLGPVIHGFRRHGAARDAARRGHHRRYLGRASRRRAGRPVFVLLPFTPDWRWMGARENSPWYPTMRLFRQATSRDWPGVVSASMTPSPARWARSHENRACTKLLERNWEVIDDATNSRQLAGTAMLLCLAAGAAVAADDGAVANLGSQPIKAADLKDFIDSLNPAQREQAARDPKIMVQLVRSAVGRKVVIEEAEKQGWDKKPDVAG